MKSFTLTLIYEDPLEESTFQLSEVDKSLLENFLQFARKIESSKIVKIGMPFSFNSNHKQGEEATVIFTLPDWEYVESYIHRLRPIILQNEKTNFYKICNLLAHKIEIPRIRKAIKEEKMLFQGEGINGIMKVKLNDQIITSEDMLQKYLNAFEFHKDEDKRQEIKKLNEAMPLETMKVFIFWLLQEKGGAILRIAEFVRKIIDTINGIESEPIKAELLASRFRKE